MKFTSEINKLYIYSLISLFIICILSVLTSKYYSADGANYLLTLITNEELTIVQNGRVFARYLLQIPALIAIKVGITNFQLISALLGIPYFLQIIVSLICTNWFLGEKNKSLIVFPILTIFVLILNTEYAIESESITLASFFWPIFTYLYYFEEKKSLLKSTVFICFALIVPYTYETFFICSIPLIWLFYTRSNITFKILFIPFYVLSSIHQFYNIIFHQFKPNTGSFMYSVFPSLFGLLPNGRIEYLNLHLLGIFILFGYLIYLIFSKKERTVNYWILGVLSFTNLIIITLNPHLLSYSSQFSTRTLTSISPLIFSFLFIRSMRIDLKSKIIKYNKLIIFIIVFQTSASLLSTFHWMQFSKSLRNAISKSNGLFVYNIKDLDTFKIDGRNYVSNFQIWSLPAYSLFLNTGKESKSIAYAYCWKDHFMTKDQIQIIRSEKKLRKYGFNFNDK